MGLNFRIPPIGDYVKGYRGSLPPLLLQLGGFPKDLPDYVERLADHVVLPEGVAVWGLSDRGPNYLPTGAERPLVAITLQKGRFFSAFLPLRPTQAQVDQVLEPLSLIRDP